MVSMSRSTEKKAYSWLLGQTGPARGWLLASVMLGLGGGLLLIVQAWLLADMIDQLVMSGSGREPLVRLFIWTFIVIVMRAAFAWAREVCGFKAGVMVRALVRKALLDKLTRLGPVAIAEKPAGSWSTIVVEQVEELHDFVARYLPQMALAALLPLVMVVVVFPMNWVAALVFLITAPLIPLFMALVGMKAAEANRKNFQALNRLGGFFLDRLQGLETLKLFQRIDHEHQAMGRASEDFRVKTMQVLRLAFLSSTVLEFFASISIAVLAVYLGMSFLGYLNFGGPLFGDAVGVSLFTGLFILLLAPEFYQPLRDLGSHYHAKARAIGASDSILDVLERHESNVPDGNQSFDSTVPLHIEARNLSVKGTAGGRLLLENLTFSIQQGERVAIVGSSGAGKTTLVNSLMGFWGYQGSLSLSGQELTSLSMESWRRQMAWLGQQPLIIHGSVYENVSFGRGLSEDEVLEALARAQAREIVDRLPQGLKTPLQEQGGNLSIGQAQRIALARAIARPVKLLILDEPTASLDSHNERLVLDTLESMPEDCTVITVTHRLGQLDQMDRILMLENGQLIADGDPKSLRNTSEPFKAFVAGMQESLDHA